MTAEGTSDPTPGLPIISVITPARDVGWIGAAVDSVLAQTERRFEYLVVDDGSTDDTVEVVARRAWADGRVRLLRSGGSGSGAARHVGLAAARAPFVAFLGGDDIWNERFLQRHLAVFAVASAEVGAVHCHSRIMLEGGQVVTRRWQPAGRCDLDVLLAENFPPHNGSSFLVRRSCFDEAGVFDTAMTSAVDMEMWLGIATRSST